VLSPRNHLYHIGYLSNEINAVKRLWRSNYIGEILRNEAYIGIQAQGKRERHGRLDRKKPKSEWIIHENMHPAIVDKSQFNAVQKLLEEAKEKRKQKHKRLLDENIYSGKLFCSRCGKAATRIFFHTKSLGNRYKIRCRSCGYYLRHTLGIEKLPTLWLEKLEEIITVVLQKQIDVCQNISDLISKASKSEAVRNKHNNLTSELSQLQCEIKKNDEMLATAYTHHLAGLLDSSEFNIAREKFERDKKTAEIRMEQVSQDATKYDIKKANQNAFITNFQRFNGFTKLDKEIVNALIHRIDIEPLTNAVHIMLNFTNELEELNQVIEESGVLSDVR